MTSTSLHVTIDPSIKQKAQRVADELGLSLSAVVKVLLKQFIRTKELSVGITEIPNENTVKSLKQSEKDIKEGKTIAFKNTEDALSYIDSLIADDEKNKTKTKNRILANIQ